MLICRRRVREGEISVKGQTYFFTGCDQVAPSLGSTNLLHLIFKITHNFKNYTQFLSARKAELKKGFQHLVVVVVDVVVLVVLVLVVGTRAKKRFKAAERDSV
jgi:hypothetical protein